jgi:hypothetical protein
MIEMDDHEVGGHHGAVAIEIERGDSLESRAHWRPCKLGSMMRTRRSRSGARENCTRRNAPTTDDQSWNGME